MSDEMPDDIEIDWGAAKDAFDNANDPGELLPEGTFIMRCEAAEWMNSKAGNPMIRCRHQAAEHPETETVWSYWVCIPPKEGEKTNFATARFYQTVTAHGVQPMELAAQGVPPDKLRSMVADGMVGELVNATIEHEEYGGQTRAKIGEFTSIEGDQSAEVTAIEDARKEWENAAPATSEEEEPF